MIRLNHLHFDYKSMPMDFNLHIRAQEKVAVIGHSGAGKSTLLNLIAGFEFAQSGEIWLNGMNHSKTQPHLRPVSMLFQDNNLFTHLTVEQNIALGLKPSLKLTALEQDQIKQAASAVGLSAFLTRMPATLSGGQRQRAAIARCLLRNQPILLLDEPFSALDPGLRMEMQRLLNRLCDEKKLTLMLVTHQPQELKQFIDRTVRVDNGKIISS